MGLLCMKHRLRSSKVLSDNVCGNWVKRYLFSSLKYFHGLLESFFFYGNLKRRQLRAQTKTITFAKECLEFHFCLNGN